MTKKNEEMTEDNYTDEGEGSMAELGNLDFNVDDEYKPTPLIAKGTYHGAITNVKFDGSKPAIVWAVTLHDNGGVMSDEETPIDGAQVYAMSWLPKKGDEDVLIKSGKMSKRQWKINALRDLGAELGINVSTPGIIAEAINEALWMGIEVSVDVEIDEYNGKHRNSVNRMKKSTMY